MEEPINQDYLMDGNEQDKIQCMQNMYMQAAGLDPVIEQKLKDYVTLLSHYEHVSQLIDMAKSQMV